MRLVYAVDFEVNVTSGSNSAEVAHQVREAICKWVSGWYSARKHLEVTVPEEGCDLVPLTAHSVSVVYRQTQGASHWQVVWSYPSEPDQNVNWRSVAEVGDADGKVEFSFQLMRASRHFQVVPQAFVLRAPVIVRTVIENFQCSVDGRRLTNRPTETGAQSIQDLLASMTAPDRRVPIILVSTDLFSERPLVDPQSMANVLTGLAETWVIDKWGSYALTENVGKELSCYGGAVRIYWPGFRKTDDPYSHYLYLPAKLNSLDQDNRPLSAELLRRFSQASTFGFSYGSVIRASVEKIEVMRAKELGDMRRKAEDSGDYRQLFELSDKENGTLSGEISTLKERLTQVEGDLEAANLNLKELFEAQEPEPLPGTSQEMGLPEPETVLTAVEQAKNEFRDTLVFLSSALSSAKESPYKQPDKVYQNLQAMDEVCQRRRDSSSKKTSMGSLELAFRARNAIYAAKESMTAKGKWREQYEALYRGKKISIEEHLVLGNGGPDVCLRIHFAWDKETQQFVIAHVGRHKTNTST